ncbi:hypothetical protein PR202_gb15690 [Eleusine coracana subsp. coracana]|uniref:Uncharacterized protein n=1 Tax=Eleusine coracana subsp. coracana TaxID=191504 RepID=A0AAV5EYJ1_ELECO|nr:hypothetical protein QOZ80_4BG0349240 [Eleusine coracana subsp. coracana]GJN27649.1 hypothetical protein PR202_gb15690 [Eleusine coracana subsp. coracana]
MMFQVQDLFVLFLVLLLPLYYYLVFFRNRKSTSNEPQLPTDWPLVSILPSLLISNLHRIHDHMATVLAAAGGSFDVRGPPGLRFFVTCDPANTRHIFVSGFGNYPKGEEFASFFDVMGDSFFNADGESWRRQRVRVQRIMVDPRLQSVMARCCRDKVETGLLPVLAHMAGKGASFDLQDVFARFSFDMTAKPVFGVDTGRLSVDMPPMDVSNAMDAVMEVGFFRHTVPAPCWRLMRRFRIGPERSLAAAKPVLRRFVDEMLERRKKLKGGVIIKEDHTAGSRAAPDVDIASNYVDDPEYVDERGKPREFLYATLINYMVAGRDTVGTTLTWLFYNLVKHPRVADAIRAELAPIVAARKLKPAAAADTTMVVFEPEETKPLVYLHAALFESMRLYPPAPIERKEALADDVLPSGHRVRAGDTLLIPVYSLGRMESAWGKDCTEYRPERWVTEDGKLRHVPAHKFLTFNAGPRSCLGKDISVVQMKCVIAAVVWNFDFEIVEGHVAEPKLSIIMQMKNGLMVKAKRRHAVGGGIGE